MSAVNETSRTKTVCITSHSGRTLKYDHSGRSLRATSFKQPVGVRRLSVLSDLEAGGEAILVSLNLPPAVTNHLMYMGFVPDAQIRMLRRAPAGDPTVYVVDGMVVALRHETAKSIQVKPVTQDARIKLAEIESLSETSDEPLAVGAKAEIGLGARAGARG